MSLVRGLIHWSAVAAALLHFSHGAYAAKHRVALTAPQSQIEAVFVIVDARGVGRNQCVSSFAK